MQNQTINESNTARTTLFVRNASDTAFNQIPALFYNQADQQYSKHQLTGQDLLNRLVNIELIQPKLATDVATGKQYVTAKLQIKAVMDDKLNFVPMDKSKAGAPAPWLKGHYSPAIRFDSALVEAGFITNEEMQALVDYVGFWEALGDTAYAKGNTKQRLYLTAKDASALFQFFYVERQNPKTGAPTLGIEEVGWSGCKLIGSTVTGEVANLQAAVIVNAASEGGAVNRPIAAAAPVAVGAAVEGRVRL